MRGLDSDFLNAMREKLERGRRKGRVGWDTKWNCYSDTSYDRGARGPLMKALVGECIELAIAVERGDLEEIRHEAADVANFAMFVADIHGALK